MLGRGPDSPKKMCRWGVRARIASLSDDEFEDASLFLGVVFARDYFEAIEKAVVEFPGDKIHLDWVLEVE